MKKSNVLTPVSTFRILLVDDNRNGLLARKSILEEHGFLVSACSSPDEAFAVFNKTAYDLVITDYRMPLMNGTQLIGKIRDLNSGIPIVLISSMVDALGLNEKNTGADAVVAKSANEIAHLIRAVNRLLIPKKPASSLRVSPKAADKAGAGG
jgi:CheY-like chemotaxis protein